MKKRIVSLLLCALLAFSCLVPASAALTVDRLSPLPTIIVPGFAACALFRQNPDGSLGEQVWGWNIIADLALNKVKQIAPQLLAEAGLLPVGGAKLLGKTLGKAIRDLAWELRCDGSGQSVNALTTIPNDPALCRWDVLKETYGSEFLCEQDIGGNLTDYIPKTQLYNFYVDFRMGVMQTAEELHRYVKAVKEYTGSDKVNIYSLSHGGQVTATYLNLYGDEGDVDNAVLTVPAIGGAGFACDFLSNGFRLDEEELVVMIEAALNREEDFEWLVKAHQLGVLDDVLGAAVPYAQEAAYCWQSLWDFVPLDRFDGFIAAQDPAAYGGLIAATTAFHRNVMATMGEKLRACRDRYGINVNILAGYGNGTVTGFPEYADAILTVNATTGAKCAPVGKRFADGYVCEGTVCADPSHGHLSPAMDVDASTAYLPENTWFVDGYFHGFTMNEPYTKELALTLLFTDDLSDVRTDPRFPQFAFSTNRAYSVTGGFDASAPGFLSAADAAFTVTNLSGDNEIRVLSLNAAGLDLRFDGPYNRPIAPGESAVFTVSGDLPAVSGVRTAVTITYKTKGTVTPYGERTLAYTLQNGDRVAFDAAAPFADRDAVTPLEEKLPGGIAGLLKKIGLFDLTSMLFNIFRRICINLKASLPFAG